MAAVGAGFGATGSFVGGGFMTGSFLASSLGHLRAMQQ
jgi:hypothetical protein